MINEREIQNNKVEKIVSILSNELKVANNLLEYGEDLINNIDQVKERYMLSDDAEFNFGGLSNGGVAFANALDIYRDLTMVLRTPNVVNSNIITEKVNTYIDGLLAAYRKEKERLKGNDQSKQLKISNLDFDFIEMSEFSKQFFKDKDLKRITELQEEALDRFQTKQEQKAFFESAYHAYLNKKELRLWVEQQIGQSLYATGVEQFDNLKDILSERVNEPELINLRNKFVEAELMKIKNEEIKLSDFLNDSNIYHEQYFSNINNDKKRK